MYEVGRSAEGLSLQFPDQFRGVFARSRSHLEPLIVEARDTLERLPIPPVVRPYYSYGVLEHAQPSFVLAPLMFLAMAESQGGITKKHTGYLPAFLLMVELIGILDDTVDHTPKRSGRTTYWRRFGAASAAPFSCFLFSAAVEQTMQHAPELLPLVTQMFATICASESWEHDARYPASNEAALAMWLQRHYDAVPSAIAHSLDSALVLHGLPTLDREVYVRFAELQQDVDDIVNFVEHREDDGENDDLKMGIVTYPLLATIHADADLSAVLDRLWGPCRDLKLDLDPWTAAKAGRPEIHAAYELVAQRVAEVGVGATIEKIARDAQFAIDAASPEARACVADLVWTFVERLCRIDALRPDVERLCPAVRRLG